MSGEEPYTTPSIRVRDEEELNSTTTTKIRILPEWILGKIKTEPQQQTTTTDNGDTANVNNSLKRPYSAIKTEEPEEEESTSGGGQNQVKTEKVVKTEVKEEIEQQPTSTTPSNSVRQCCKFGVKCFRRNIVHRTEEAHPGDADYRLPDYPDPPPGVPKCPYAQSCYRRNPTHFQAFSHAPGSADRPVQAKQPRAPPKRRRRSSFSDDDEALSDDSIFEFLTDNDEDDDEPYSGEESSDYNPDEDED